MIFLIGFTTDNVRCIWEGIVEEDCNWNVLEADNKGWDSDVEVSEGEFACWIQFLQVLKDPKNNLRS